MQEQCHNDSYDHVLKYTGMFGGVQVLVTLIGLVRNKFMALLLGTAGVGFNALFMSMQNFASQCTNLGISFGAVPKLSEYYEGQQEEQPGIPHTGDPVVEHDSRCGGISVLCGCQSADE